MDPSEMQLQDTKLEGIGVPIITSIPVDVQLWAFCS